MVRLIAGEKGFTILEVMIALAIVAGVLVTVITSLNYHLRVSHENSDLVTAAIIGREKMEDSLLRGLPVERSGAFDGELSRYRWSLDTMDTEIPGLKRIEYKVLWKEGGGDDRSVSFVSYRRSK